MTMIEKAIAAAKEVPATMVDDVRHVLSDRAVERVVRAVLLAFREPDQSVVDRGTAQINYDDPAPNDAPPDDDYSADIRRSFTAMIDAILNEDPK